MRALYAGGATLEEVGARFGLSRERVRQILQEAGIKTRSIGETSALRRDRLLRERGDEIRAAFSELKDIDAVARRLEVPRALVREVVARSFPASERKSRRSPMYSSEELIACLKEAGAAPGRLTTGKYAKYAEGRQLGDGRPWPSFQTLAKRFGTWRRALAEAESAERKAR